MKHLFVSIIAGAASTIIFKEQGGIAQNFFLLLILANPHAPNKTLIARYFNTVQSLN